MMSVNLSDIAILNIKGSDYCCIISWISSNLAIGLKQNADLLKKVEHYKLKNTNILKSYLKMEKSVIKFGDIEIQNKNFINLKDLIQ